MFGLPNGSALDEPDITLVLDAEPDWRTGSSVGAAVRYRTPASEAAPGDTLTVYELDQGFLFRYPDETEFHVSRDGREIWATWAPPATLADTETYLLGPVLGFAQRLMGMLCLHASAVVVDDLAIALCGPGSAGKSTTAGAFGAEGFGVLADDMTALRERDGRAFVQPAYDHLRVWESSERILLGSSGSLPRLTPTWDKRALRLRGQGWTFREEPAPLRAVVLLAAREDDVRSPRVEVVASGDAFIAIAANTYTNYLLDSRMRAEEFAGIARLMAKVKILRATPHADPARLGDLVRAIVAAVRA